jgi:hypothetical protein
VLFLALELDLGEIKRPRGQMKTKQFRVWRVYVVRAPACCMAATGSNWTCSAEAGCSLTTMRISKKELSRKTAHKLKFRKESINSETNPVENKKLAMTLNFVKLFKSAKTQR